MGEERLSLLKLLTEWFESLAFSHGLAVAILLFLSAFLMWLMVRSQKEWRLENQKERQDLLHVITTERDEHRDLEKWVRRQLVNEMTATRVVLQQIVTAFRTLPCSRSHPELEKLEVNFEEANKGGEKNDSD